MMLVAKNARLLLLSLLFFMADRNRKAMFLRFRKFFPRLCFLQNGIEILFKSCKRCKVCLCDAIEYLLISLELYQSKMAQVLVKDLNNLKRLQFGHLLYHTTTLLLKFFILLLVVFILHLDLCPLHQLNRPHHHSPQQIQLRSMNIRIPHLNQSSNNCTNNLTVFFNNFPLLFELYFPKY